MDFRERDQEREIDEKAAREKEREIQKYIFRLIRQKKSINDFELDSVMVCVTDRQTRQRRREKYRQSSHHIRKTSKRLLTNGTACCEFKYKLVSALHLVFEFCSA